MLTRFLDLILPRRCVLCTTPAAEGLCISCRGLLLSDTKHPRCPLCAIELGHHTAVNSGLSCGDCLKHPPFFDATIKALDYLPPADSLVLRLKFGGDLAIARAMAVCLRDQILDSPLPSLPDVLCPVPLGARRLQERGFNQALEIGRHLSLQLGIPLAQSLIQRIKETEAQSGLRLAQRQTNMRRAFLIKAEQTDSLVGKHIGIVDDVMTTGTTLNALAQELKHYGVSQVTNFIFARTPKPH